MEKLSLTKSKWKTGALIGLGGIAVSAIYFLQPSARKKITSIIKKRANANEHETLPLQERRAPRPPYVRRQGSVKL
ncbi:hypothetical protein [Priestia koreensis]|uniref:hypothetical protein n=1 Tax=Priestia koreensis TaxID=284581 RepID=UPI001F58BE59|nr:hypothetical protein [Priestia koreensis]UNL83565.1 hypothetical protein IE339_15510 [Priestia koreensis]